MNDYETGREAGYDDGRRMIAEHQTGGEPRRLPASHADAHDWLIGYAAGIQLAARRYLGGAQE